MHRFRWMTILALVCAAGVSGGIAAAQEGHAKPATARQSYDRYLLRPSALTRRAPATYKVKFVTTKGDFVISVTRAWAPLGADRFYNLARHHFYDNTAFFRVLKGFVVQWGLSAYPPVNSAWDHAPIHDDPVVQSNLRGYVTYAMGGPNTRTTQVFINLVDNKRLDGMGFAPFGQVTQGMDVVEALYSGYGEGAPDGRGPSQDEIEKSGKTYLDAGFPNLDSIKTTELIVPEAEHPAATAKAKPAAEKK
ncbi:MAG TPA: peptidylprolyl isomerase [Candidatus Acidoferrum sp.]|nr:peptidylprolyl isomerase [Candidatus Acidoferrum sp.]